jgi:hypothetical protein
MLVEAAQEMATGSQGSLSKSMTVTSKWVSMLCLLILLASTTTIFGPAMTCTGPGMEQNYEVKCRSRLTTRKYINLRLDLSPGMPMDVPERFAHTFPDVPRDDKDHNYIWNRHEGGFSFLPKLDLMVDPEENRRLSDSKENVVVLWNWYNYLPLYFILLVGISSLPRYAWLRVDGKDLERLGQQIDDLNNSVEDKLLLVNAFLFGNKRSLLRKFSYFIILDVASLGCLAIIYCFLNEATNGGFTFFFGLTLEMLNPGNTLALKYFDPNRVMFPSECLCKIPTASASGQISMQTFNCTMTYGHLLAGLLYFFWFYLVLAAIFTMLHWLWNLLFLFPNMQRSFIIELISLKERDKATSISQQVKLPQLWALLMIRKHGRDTLLGDCLLFAHCKAEMMEMTNIENDETKDLRKVKDASIIIQSNYQEAEEPKKSKHHSKELKPTSHLVTIEEEGGSMDSIYVVRNQDKKEIVTARKIAV